MFHGRAGKIQIGVVFGLPSVVVDFGCCQLGLKKEDTTCNWCCTRHTERNMKTSSILSQTHIYLRGTCFTSKGRRNHETHTPTILQQGFQNVPKNVCILFPPKGLCFWWLRWVSAVFIARTPRRIRISRKVLHYIQWSCSSVEVNLEKLRLLQL